MLRQHLGESAAAVSPTAAAPPFYSAAGAWRRMSPAHAANILNFNQSRVKLPGINKTFIYFKRLARNFYLEFVFDGAGIVSASASASTALFLPASPMF
jgi:hypothetical protein